MNSPTWPTLNWNILDRLRRVFLGLEPAAGSYWSSPADLAHYDVTYAQRIGWKWDAVLRDLQRIGWTPPPGPLLDWGCGSGVAGRAVLDAFGADRFGTLLLFDRSPLATGFAAERARARFPGLDVRIATDPPPPDTTLVISHAINELADADLAALLDLARRSAAVLWVEPGTHADSRALCRAREALRATLDVAGPCTHAAACGMLAPSNERDWCHFFAEPPAGIMADADWVRFAQRAGIDLRSLPYSYLALQRRGGSPSSSRYGAGSHLVAVALPGSVPPGLRTGGPQAHDSRHNENGCGSPGAAGGRIVGAPRVYKGFAKVLLCRADGVREETLNKRDDPAFFARLKRDREFAAVTADR